MLSEACENFIPARRDTHTSSVRANLGAVDHVSAVPSRALPTPHAGCISSTSRRRTVACRPTRAAAASPGDVEMLEVMGKLYEHAYEGVDRDAALEIAEQSHKNQARVPGIGYFYGELSWSGAWMSSGWRPEGG